MSEAEAEQARFVRALDRFRVMAAEAAQDCLLTAVQPDSTDDTLASAAFHALIGYMGALEQALAASDIQTDS